ncbi:unnamed protein product [Tuber aestivum]|uniref:YTH domain-containing protein n=1 Tax=Tuber aestivum TaxID=59557 RepID=A0A292PXX2_9PEZI|nr:unnamed protein product [Tuber aestivum]
MSLDIDSSGDSNISVPRGNDSGPHLAPIRGTLCTLNSAPPTNEAHAIMASSQNLERHGARCNYTIGASVIRNEEEREDGRHETEPEETEHLGDFDHGDSDSESTMGEFGLKYDEDSDAARGSNESDEVPEYSASNEGLSEPMRARNRSGPPIPPPVPVRPGQLFFSNQIWTRLNVEQQLKLGALKVGSKNKSFKTRPWLVVERSNRVDSDGQQMLWVMCCTTRNRNGWEGVSYRDSKSFIPMAPTPSRFGRPVLPLVTDDRDVFLGGSLLFLEVFKEIKASLLGDYIGHISDASVSIVNREQLRIAEERRKKEEFRALHPSAFKTRGGNSRRGSDRYRARAETNPDQYDNNGSGHSGHQYDRDGWIAPNHIPPFHLPACTNETQVSPPLNPKAPAFRDPANQGHRDNRRRSFNGRVIQNRQQHNAGHQNYPGFNQMPDGGNHYPQTYGGRSNYGNPGGYGGHATYGGHENNGHHGLRHRSRSDSFNCYNSPQQNYRGHQNPGYSPNIARDLVHTSASARGGNQTTSPVSGPPGHWSGNVGNSGWASCGFTPGGPGWTTTPRRDHRR